MIRRVIRIYKKKEDNKDQEKHLEDERDDQ